MKVCFFAHVPQKDILNTVSFYATDIQILRELGHEVILATRFSEIPFGCDFYFIWWWTWAFMPLIKALNKPALITGTFDYITHPVEKSYIHRPLLEKFLMNVGLRRANANLFISHFEYDAVTSNLPTRNPQYVPCSVDTNVYTPADVPRENFIFNVAWSGEFNARRKCLKQIIEAFPSVLAQHPDTRLVMAGRQGEYHPILVETAQALGISDKVDFIGVISEEEKIRLMQRCAVYVQPTLEEGFGLAIAEAMACGTAVVTSPVGAVPEVVGENGILVDGQDVSAISNGIIYLLNDPSLRDNLGSRARDFIVQHYQYARRRDALAKIIHEITQH
jgi:glycosyltransferase involved in cell wall biosynthesis